jgi:hypothetical protein
MEAAMQVAAKRADVPAKEELLCMSISEARPLAFRSLGPIRHAEQAFRSLFDDHKGDII